MSLASMADKIVHGHRAVSPPPAHGLRPVPEVDEASVPLTESFSSTQSASPPPSARPPAQSFHRREAYHRVPSDGAVDLSSFDGGFSPGPLYRQSSMTSVGEGSFFLPPDAGIESRSPRRSFARVPVGSKTSSPDTPRSFHRFMDTPRMGTASPDLTRSLTQSPETSPRKANFFGGLRNSISQPKSTGDGPSFFKKWFPASWGSRSTAKEPPLYSAGRNDRGGHVHENESLPGPHPHRDGKTYDQVRLESLDRSKRSASPDDIEEDDDDRPLHARYNQAPHYCDSHRDVHAKRISWLSVSVLVLSVYSTALSCMWFIVAVYQPRWGRAISSSGGINPATASVVCTLFAKTIEMSFVTVFITFLGQVLTRRSFVKRSKGMTLAEMTMRNWVIQPGSLITHWETIPSAAVSFLGVVALIATVAATFYTTASEAMVTPKIKFGAWEDRVLQGLVTSTYANPVAVGQDCPTPLRAHDPAEANGACLNVQYSGQSYRNFMSFLGTWNDVYLNGTSLETDLRKRPVGTSLLYDNTTMTAAWIETEHSNVTKLHEKHGRIINNVTLAMPHPGVYSAATDRVNGILQPDDLSDVGEYAIKAGVVSPAVNALCVNLSEEELEPLVYTAWENALTNETTVEGQRIGHEGWQEEIPVIDKDEFLNRTEVDDIFAWGPKYKRRPPVFQLFPADNNILTNVTYVGPHAEWEQPRRDALYVLLKSAAIPDYTLCELRSWLSPNCSTHFNISGISGAHLRAHCEDPDDEDSYLRSFPEDTAWSVPDADWANLADQWRLSMDLNGGTYNNDASNARILTQLILGQPKMPSLLPSMAEALAVLASSTLTMASLGTPYRHWWEYQLPQLANGVHESFNASIRTQQYTSSHTFEWQNIFYVVLFVVFAINVFCLVYLLLGSGMVTDYTDPQNLFALAVNSPPSAQLGGSCGGVSGSKPLQVPWRVGYSKSANHYFFEPAGDKALEGSDGSLTSRSERYHESVRERGASRSSYKRLSTSRTWL